MNKETNGKGQESLASATGSAATAEYTRGVTAACEWLEKYKLTEEEEKDGVTWQRDCPQTFAWLIRTELLPPNSCRRTMGAKPQRRLRNDFRVQTESGTSRNSRCWLQQLVRERQIPCTIGEVSNPGVKNRQPKE